MSTIVGLETVDGALLAGDRIHVEGGTRVSEGVRRVFNFEAVGAAAIGDPGAIDEFERRLEAETRRYRVEHEEPMAVGRLARTAASIAEEVGVDAIVSARDDEGVARIRSVDRDGAVLSDEMVAFGSGAQLALGQLEGVDTSGDIQEVETRIRDVFATIADRDTETGEEVDTWTLENAD